MGQEFGLLGECIASRTCRGLAYPEDSDKGLISLQGLMRELLINL